MVQLAWGLAGIAVLTVAYAYLIYPLCLQVLSRRRGRRGEAVAEVEWPAVTITIPVYNEVKQVDELLESVLRLDYPADRLQVLVVSDASDDGTDERVAAFAGRGIELLRMPRRGGKSAAENAARPLLRGEIIVNTDASIRIDRHALKPLIAAFRDPAVGLASGRDVSVTRLDQELNGGESVYVGYEMWVRALETRVSGIVGASGCFYAIRRDLHQYAVPEGLSRDFAAAMVTREQGYRAVSVAEAVCYVPRAGSLKHEYRRKVRTITRGMQTLYFKRHLLNPRRYGVFSWMLASHKVCRWAAPWAAAIGVIGLAMLATAHLLAGVALAGAALVGVLAWIGWQWPEGRALPRLFGMPAFLVAGNVAVMHATVKAMRGELNAVWEPTRRDAPGGSSQAPPPSRPPALVDGR